MLQQWKLQRLEIFFLFMTIVFIPLHFLIQINNPIYGDGAVYANLGRYVAEGNFYPLRFRTDCESIFADHPYLFFYFLGFFYNIFSFQEIAIKIPNLIFGLLTVFTLYCFLREEGQYKNRLGAIIAVFCLGFSPNYQVHVRGPFLDVPLVFFSVLSVYFLFQKKYYFLSGLSIAGAFLTKGVEGLPLLGAYALIFSWNLFRKKESISNILIFISGFLLPLFIFTMIDGYYNNFQWFISYYHRQFSGRFFLETNHAKGILSPGFFITFLRNYQPFLPFLLFFSYFYIRRKKYNDLFFFLWIWIFLILLAFCIIKKDSSQHLMSIYCAGAILLGITAKDFFLQAKEKTKKIFSYSSVAVITLFAIAILSAHIYNIVQPEPDNLQHAIKNRTIEASIHPNFPVIISPEYPNESMFVFTAMWYWPNPIYNYSFFEKNKKIILSKSNGYYFYAQAIPRTHFLLEIRRER